MKAAFLISFFGLIANASEVLCSNRIGERFHVFCDGSCQIEVSKFITYPGAGTAIEKQILDGGQCQISNSHVHCDINNSKAKGEFNLVLRDASYLFILGKVEEADRDPMLTTSEFLLDECHINEGDNL